MCIKHWHFQYWEWVPAISIHWGTAAGPLSWSVGMTVEGSESFIHVFEVLSGHSEALSSSRSHQIWGRASPGLQDSVSVGLSPLVCAQGGCDLLTPHGHSADTRLLSTFSESQASMKIRSHPCLLTSGVKGLHRDFCFIPAFNPEELAPPPIHFFCVLKCKTYIPIYKIDNPQGPTVQHRELY